jgi:hypothetical protein
MKSLLVLVLVLVPVHRNSSARVLVDDFRLAPLLGRLVVPELVKSIRLKSDLSTVQSGRLICRVAVAFRSN